jgi:hypothetical protein
MLGIEGPVNIFFENELVGAEVQDLALRRSQALASAI